ncbi:methyltransferase domain-containing protein [Clostridiaceae bacterium M8S5]|nr:methyltransferase domain-containing protein [Clostridiaceae bacterium M8S5]
MKRRESFDSAAKIYDESRPSYPDEVIEWVIDRTNVSKNNKLLEIGAGTGQATLKFAEKGYKIHCIEMGKNLADILAKKGSNYDITVDVSSFEKWEPKTSFKTSFIFSATAFHWIEKSIKYKKCYDLLDDNGYLVLLWHVAPNIEIKEVKEAYELLWDYYPERKSAKVVQDDIKSNRKLEIINSGYFYLADYLDYKWKIIETKDKLTKEFFSQSSYLALDNEKQKILYSKIQELYENLDDVIETDMYTTAYIAKRK